MPARHVLITMSDPGQEAEIRRRLAGMPGVQFEAMEPETVEPLTAALEQLRALLTSGPLITEEDYRAFCATRRPAAS